MCANISTRQSLSPSWGSQCPLQRAFHMKNMQNKARRFGRRAPETLVAAADRFSRRGVGSWPLTRTHAPSVCIFMCRGLLYSGDMKISCAARGSGIHVLADLNKATHTVIAECLLETRISLQNYSSCLSCKQNSMRVPQLLVCRYGPFRLERFRQHCFRTLSRDHRTNAHALLRVAL